MFWDLLTSMGLINRWWANHTSEIVLMPVSRTSHSFSLFGAPGIFTAIPTIAIGPCVDVAPSFAKQVFDRSTIDALPRHNFLSIAFDILVSGPKLRSFTGIPSGTVATVFAATEIQSTCWMIIISTTRSTKVWAPMASHTIALPSRDERIGARMSTKEGNLMLRLVMSERTRSRTRSTSTGAWKSISKLVMWTTAVVERLAENVAR